ncbi:hypothetical protein [Sporolactobacillus inulinus]|nr:hypothetical protein [Sporolactobacillus inulinus]
MSAPKALINKMRYEEFYTLYLKVHDRDILLFEKMIDVADSVNNNQLGKNLDLLITKHFSENKDFYSEIELELDRIYEKNEMVYTGKMSKFL